MFANIDAFCQSAIIPSGDPMKELLKEYEYIGCLLRSVDFLTTRRTEIGAKISEKFGYIPTCKPETNKYNDSHIQNNLLCVANFLKICGRLPPELRARLEAQHKLQSQPQPKPRPIEPNPAESKSPEQPSPKPIEQPQLQQPHLIPLQLPNPIFILPQPVEQPKPAEVPKPKPVEQPKPAEVPKPKPAEVPKPKPVEQPKLPEVPKPKPAEAPKPKPVEVPKSQPQLMKQLQHQKGLKRPADEEKHERSVKYKQEQYDFNSSDEESETDSGSDLSYDDSEYIDISPKIAKMKPEDKQKEIALIKPITEIRFPDELRERITTYIKMYELIDKLHTALGNKKKPNIARNIQMAKDDLSKCDTWAADISAGKSKKYYRDMYGLRYYYTNKLTELSK